MTAIREYALKEAMIGIASRIVECWTVELAGERELLERALGRSAFAKPDNPCYTQIYADAIEGDIELSRRPPAPCKASHRLTGVDVHQYPARSRPPSRRGRA